ncbi:hypothetical protein [Novipirellula artificiosorum]|uniref:Uncharacterized protein n=1 Tax=Novipirellula artificiosorum TaxID=2528016 RepID=A0A5C6DAG1_9BACT|nr:hypothetical protein [Novipirellula artificiosorum]TWU32226.1 hypothetical protein Poly41_57110 [Novipirellula artificiosorum]
MLPSPSGNVEDAPHDGTTAKGPLYVKEVKDDLPLASWATTAGAILGPLATAGLVSVFAMFMLIHREDLRDRIISVVIGCTSHHFSETLVLNLLRIGGAGLYQLDSVDDEILPQAVGQEIARREPSAVVIVLLPKGGFAQARHLCKAIRGEGYTGPILVSCLGKFKNFDKLFVKFRKAGATSMTTSHSQTRSKIESILKRRDPVTAAMEEHLIPRN